ncbi:hypothetical protein MMC10_005014 [Thelotrema lepadinum]|nr:hypothetical protein [Thelotrema lepadinum]
MSLLITYREAYTNETPAVDIDVQQSTYYATFNPHFRNLSTIPIDVSWDQSPSQLRMTIAFNHPNGLKLNLTRSALSCVAHSASSNFGDSSYDEYERDLVQKEQGAAEGGGRAITAATETTPLQQQVPKSVYETVNVMETVEDKVNVKGRRKGKKTCPRCTRRFKNVQGKLLHLRSAHQTTKTDLNGTKL